MVSLFGLQMTEPSSDHNEHKGKFWVYRTRKSDMEDFRDI